MVRIYHWC